MSDVRAKALNRLYVRRRVDRATRSVLLEYTGPGLSFDETLYGWPEGVFFAVSVSEVPLPDSTIALGAELGVEPSTMPAAAQLREAVVEAMVAEAMVKAPELLAELTSRPVHWLDWDRRELERKHTVALTRVREARQLLEAEMRLRSDMTRHVELLPIKPPAPLPPAAGLSYFRPPLPAPPPEPIAAPEPLGEPPEPELPPLAEEAETIVPASRVVEQAAAATKAAREAELPQRLPGGARRRLQHFTAGAYIAYGDAIDPRKDLCSAMADAQAMARKGRETAVIDWDGEWPVVVRRYGEQGRTVYRVEDALRRAGVTWEKAA